MSPGPARLGSGRKVSDGVDSLASNSPRYGGRVPKIATSGVLRTSEQ